jgi:SAM-dependent methyltransferase
MKEETRKRQLMYDKHTGSGYEAARYGDPHKEKYRQMRNDALLQLVQGHFPGTQRLRMLEVGCGTGMTLEYLASQSAGHELHGMDFSWTMLSQASHKRAGHASPFRLVQGDSFALPFRQDTFDVIYNTRFIHQFSHEDKKRIYGEMWRIAKPGGLVITEFYSRHSKWTLYLRRAREYPTHGQCPSAREVADIIGRPYARKPVRVIGQRAITRMLGERGLRYATAFAGMPFMGMLLEEYFVAAAK